MAEFCSACRRLGLHGSFRSIFRTLDDDGSQTISLQEFDAEAYRTINAFKDLLSKKYVTIEASWEALAKDSPGGLTANQFYTACGRIGFTGDAKKLLKYLDMETYGAGRVTMDELEFLHLPSKDDLEPVKKYTNKPILLERSKRKQVLTVEELKQALKRKYGNLVTAWRVGIDSDGDGKLTMGEFVKACRNIGIEGNFRSIFREIDNDGSAQVSLAEFDPHAAQMFNEFTACLQAKYGTLHKAWNHGLAKNSPGGLSKVQFIEACERIGFEGDAAELLSYLDLDTHGTGRVTMDELMFLGLPEEKDHVEQITMF